MLVPAEERQEGNSGAIPTKRERGNSGAFA